MITRLLVLLVCAAALPAADPAPEKANRPVIPVPAPGRFQPLFQNLRTENAAISPDGRYLALSLREGGSVFVRILEIDHPEKIVTQAPIIDDDDATAMLAMRRNENTPGRITWLGWTSPTRLVVETNRVMAKAGAGRNWLNWTGSIVAFNADGGKPRILVSPDDTDEYASGPAQPADPVLSARQMARAGTPRPPAHAGVADDAAGQDAGGADDGAPTLPIADERLLARDFAGRERTNRLKVIGHDPDRAGSLIVAVATGSTVATYMLNTDNGRLKALSTEPITANEDTLLDQQGRPRLTLANSLRSRFPLRYEYRGPKGASRSVPLDEAAGTTGFSVSPTDYFGARAVPLGFDYDSNLLYYATNTSGDRFTLASVDLATRQPGRVRMENPNYDLIAAPESGFPARGTLVFDRFRRELAGIRFDGAFATTAWIRPEWQAMQAAFENSFPGRSVQITDWDSSTRRLVVVTEGPSDPGAIHIYDTGTKQLMEFARRAPWIDANLAHRTVTFPFKAGDGSPATGLLTVPRQPRLRPVPVVVFCPDLPWQRVGSAYQAEVQALAEMGFVVLQLNGRGAWGFGRAHRQPATAGFDDLQIQDMVAALDHLGRTTPIDPARVALLGRGHGGYLALRALETRPERFRCAISLDGPVDIARWLAEQRWTGGSVQPALTGAWFANAEPVQSLAKPALLLNYPGPGVGERRTAFAAAMRLAEEARRRGVNVVSGELNTDYMNGLPRARAAVFDQIEEFLNLHVYDFSVKVHETQVGEGAR